MTAIKNDKQIQSIIKIGKVGKHSAGHGLYLRICANSSKIALWMVRYTFGGKRRELVIGNYGKNEGELTFAQATSKAINIKAHLKEGIDPAAEKKRLTNQGINTVNDLALDWIENDIKKRLKHPNIPERIYKKEVSPYIGELPIKRVTPLDIRAIIEKVAQSDRPSISNDTLMYCKQLFRHGIRLNLLISNPADAFTYHHAGGIEESRSRALALSELKTVFQLLREHEIKFTRDNYIAFALLLLTGVRKGELIAAKWEEFDAEKALWHLPKERSKTGVPITVPLSSLAMELLEELAIRSSGSEYIFPARRRGKRRGYISDDTLNHALAELFGEKAHLGRSQNNIFEPYGIAHFVVHDLRRTMRTLLSDLRVQGHVAERCLNHKLRGVEGIYDRYDYLDQRKEALDKLAILLEPVIQSSKAVSQFK